MSAEFTAFKAARSICATLRERGYSAWIVGGAPRDLLLGRVPKDFDVATDATPDEVEELFSRTVPVGKSFGVVVVVEGGVETEVATFRREREYSDGRRPDVVEYTKSMAEDAARRDLTINALYLDPVDYVSEDPIALSCKDPTGMGKKDLYGQLIRFVGDPVERILEDPLRMLRAIRFSARYNFQIEPHSYVAIRRNAALVESVSGERIRDELLGMLKTENPTVALNYLRKLGLLHRILPEVSDLLGVDQPREFHPEGDVYTHTMRVVSCLRYRNADPIVVLAGLLHDIGKPATQTFEDRIRFKGHEEKSAEMAADICDRLKLSAADKKRVVTLVGSHMRWHIFHRMKRAKRRRELSRETAADQMDLLHADISGGSADFTPYEAAHREREAMKDAPLTRVSSPSDRLVSGKDLLGMGMKSGPLLGKVLRQLEDAQLAGEITSRDDGLKLAQYLLTVR